MKDEDIPNLPGPSRSRNDMPHGNRGWRRPGYNRISNFNENRPRSTSRSPLTLHRERETPYFSPRSSSVHIRTKNSVVLDFNPALQNKRRQFDDLRNVRNTNAFRRNNKDQDKSYKKNMGFLTLQELANSDITEILANLNKKKEAFHELLQSPIQRPDMFVLMLKLMSNICKSSFDQIKLKFLLDICNSQFIIHLRTYMMDLQYVEKEDKAKNQLYWNNECEFWTNFITFCDSIILLSPSTALNKCRSLIEGTSKSSLEGLKERHNFELPKDETVKLDKLRNILTSRENENDTTKLKEKPQVDENDEPPDNFRDLSVLPRREDLICDRPFVRANILRGGYRDVEHYLDVQFRLLREDCFDVIREGIRQYIEDPMKKKYDHIRVFRNVRFTEPYISAQKVGSIVEFDEVTKKKFAKINWSHNRRFLFGSLVLFTKDTCKSLIVATILDKDEKNLCKGKIPVSVLDLEVEHELYNNDSYTMIESEVYYESYYHVLKALQNPTFPKHIAMKKYIVDVNPDPSHPSYVEENTKYRIIKTSEEILNELVYFKVLDSTTWPTSGELQLNESQYDAYKTALTREFALIQGPPGTGKTYLGVKIAKTLLKNLSKSGCILLVVCYTNHALDQFLEEISKVTSSIVRIGGQSKNEAMTKFNLNNIRKNSPRSKISSNTYNIYCEERQNFRNCMLEIRRAQEEIDSISECILSYSCIKQYIPQCDIIAQYYGEVIDADKDPLFHWLFEYLEYDLNEPIPCEPQQEELLKASSSTPRNQDDDNRNNVLIDNLDIDFDEYNGMNTSKSFSIKEAQSKLTYSIQYFNNSQNPNEKRHSRRNIAILRAQIRLFIQMRDYYILVFLKDTTVIRDYTRLTIVDRWMLYFSWTESIIVKLKEHIQPLQEKLDSTNTAYEEARLMMDTQLMRHAKVVGMTTSGAARLRKLLEALAPPIVIVEEAAEVLEQHIVTSLTNSCEHLILIGDHQQLRPSAASRRLAKTCNIEVSLFERMIMNSVHSSCLAVQHRMRPHIAALVSPHIYPDLLNHPSVEHFPDVRGVTKNLFFFTHTYKEKYEEEHSVVKNEKEGDMTLCLANYIMQQDYEPEDVTILTPYTGQMFYMKKEREKYAYLSKVKITVVDNYQGEESKIILLSLVRNNDQNIIGFLGTPNRICVALSRAREGFYIFGNIDMLKSKSELWTNIAGTLESFGSIGQNLLLKCETHTNEITNISSPDDFEKVPEGGCLLKCNFNLPCHHLCPLVCHGYDKEHSKTICPYKCERIICELSHVCPLMCKEKCKPCMQLMEKELPCKHLKKVYCHLDPSSPEIKCFVKVTIKLPNCGHEIKKPCHIDMNKVKCPVPCDLRVESCGHACTRSCHVNDDPDHVKYSCPKPCLKRKKGCTSTSDVEEESRLHQCSKKCHEACDNCLVEVTKKRELCKHKERVPCSKSPNEKLCLKKCAKKLECGHFCKKICYEICECRQKVVKPIVECGHEIEVECKIKAEQNLCTKLCKKVLACGHPCRQLCKDICDEKKCTEIVLRPCDSPCGHKVNLPCKVLSTFLEGKLEPASLMQYCGVACGAQLACGHACAGDCARCLRGRLHAPCSRRCQRTNICGHDCEEPCSQVCPPCRKKCEIRCGHSRCSRSCGQPCVPCREKCSRRCPHVQCSRQCREPCEVAACQRRCPMRLACGHACRGLCGEPCPDVCNVCRPEQFPTDFLGDAFDDDAMFIVLKDCGHIMEFETVESLMNSKSETISLPACPICRKPIINTHRYKDKVNHQIETEINPIKERVFGTKQQIYQTTLKLEEKLATLIQKAIYKDLAFSVWKCAINKLYVFSKRNRKHSLLQLNIIFIQTDILELLSDIYDKFKSSNLTHLLNNIIDQNSIICNTLMCNIQKISEQQQMDIAKEIKRMNSIVNLSKIYGHPTYLSSKTVSNIEEAANDAKESILGFNTFNEDTAIESLKKLQQALKVSGTISKQERDLIVRAIGAKAGSWYKCPNGHFYNIGQCGGAMEVSKCIECKASIGGQNHALLAGNSHASEIDNSRYAAWSEEANNMANFDLNNLF